MRKILYILLLLPFLLKGQTDSTVTFKVQKESSDTTIYEFPNKQAEFPNGRIEMMRWLATNISYPKEAYENGIHNKVYLKFVVEKDSSITNVEVINAHKVHPLLQEESIRAIKSMPKWAPAKNSEGNLVRSYYVLPINFELNDKVDDVEKK